MKIKNKLIAFACLSVLGVGITMNSASAGEFEATSGSYTYGVNEVTSEIKPRVTEYVGGGTWTHDVKVDGNLMKTCTSSYYHSTKKHSATAQVGSDKQRKTVTEYAGRTARASYTNKYGFTAKAFWNTL